MSYILDAIKKSEAERNLGVSPGALAGPTPVSGTSASVRILTVVVILNVAALGTWWWWQGRAPAPVATARVVPALTPGRASVAPDDRQLEIDQPSKPVATATVPPAPKLPRRLPEFSTHVFADDPQFRAVTLNGQRLTEGDLIGPGMRLLEITENGVVLDLDGERRELDVLQDWRN